MVEATVQGDGVNRPVIYARWRDDKPASEGHSKELISVDTPKEFFDNLEGQPKHREGCNTYLDYFEHSVRARPEAPFLGQRVPNGVDEKGKPVFGEYVWKSFKEVETITHQIARGIVKLNLATETEGDDKKWRFVGVWAKNREEWLMTHLANMYFDMTTIGFFDSMGNSAVDFILNQTELSCIFTTNEYIAKIVAMKKESLAKSIQYLVCYDEAKESAVAAAKEVGVEVVAYSAVLEAGKNAADLEFNKCNGESCPIFSYTSGTTGDSKGVKLTHNNLLASANSISTKIICNHEDTNVSYLPYPHSFEQVMLGYMLMIGGRIGYYQGDPTKLTEDCQLLKPTLFPSVPRLYNRIYGVLKGKMEQAGGCKSWMAAKALESKMQALRADATYTSGCWDKLVFRKICGALGGEVKYMVTGSAPID